MRETERHRMKEAREEEEKTKNTRRRADRRQYRFNSSRESKDLERSS